MFSRVYVEIGNICNLSCSFCSGTKRKAEQMPLSHFSLICRSLVGHTENLFLHVMGEPLLHPELPEMIDVAADFGMRVHITTNGTLLGDVGDALVDRAEKIARVSISLHAPEGNGDESRIDGYLDSVIGFAKRFSERGGYSVFRLWNLDGDAKGKRSANGRIEDALRREYGGEWIKRYSGFRIGKNTFLEYDGAFVWPSESEADSVEIGTCHALRSQIAILVDGTVVPCCLDAEGLMPLGNILESPLEQILTSKRAGEMKRGFERGRLTETLCQKCTYARRFKPKGEKK